MLEMSWRDSCENVWITIVCDANGYRSPKSSTAAQSDSDEVEIAARDVRFYGRSGIFLLNSTSHRDGMQTNAQVDPDSGDNEKVRTFPWKGDEFAQKSWTKWLENASNNVKRNTCSATFPSSPTP